MLYQIYTDGSALGRTPNYIGGYGVVVTKDGKEIDTISGSKFPSTNNEMELTALLEALKYAIRANEKNSEDTFEIYTDSAYALNSITNWMFGWARNGWVNSKKAPVANLEIIQEFYSLLKFPKSYVKFIKVKGHSGDEFNELADKLAVSSSKALKKTLEEKEKEGDNNE